MKTTETGPAELAKSLLTRTIELDHEQSMTLSGEPGTRIKVIYGWVRLAGACESDDRFLGGGEETLVRVPRRSVIRSIGRTRIEVIEAKHARRLLPEKMRRWLRFFVGPCRSTSDRH